MLSWEGFRSFRFEKTLVAFAQLKRLLLMQIIRHRRNTIDELIQTPSDYGVEVDIRSFAGRLIIHHDPFIDGIDFESWLSHYKHGTLILNVKEEGLEDKLCALMGEYAISDFFFLDQSFPFLVRTALKEERRCAVRISEYEALETALRLCHLIDWVWIDCFNQFPLTSGELAELNRTDLKTCIVSPELQGRDAHQEIPLMKERFWASNFMPTAVCTKIPELWT